MKFSFIKNILGGMPKDPPRLVAIAPPRREELSLRGVENLLNVITIPEPFSLEIAGDADGVTLLARCQDGQVVRQQLTAHYPQARLHQVSRRTTPCAWPRESGPGA